LKTPYAPRAKSARGFAGGMARGLAMGNRDSEVETRRTITSVWFDEAGVMRRWTRTRR
jgi:hypothetical protein